MRLVAKKGLELYLSEKEAKKLRYTNLLHLIQTFLHHRPPDVYATRAPTQQASQCARPLLVRERPSDLGRAARKLQPDPLYRSHSAPSCSRRAPLLSFPGKRHVRACKLSSSCPVGASPLTRPQIAACRLHITPQSWRRARWRTPIKMHPRPRAVNANYVEVHVCFPQNRASAYLVRKIRW